MKSRIKTCIANKGKIPDFNPPDWLEDAIHYETTMGSIAYGASSNISDQDIYAFCIPPKDLLFPHLTGEIPNFGSRSPSFVQAQYHHLKLDDSEYDLNIFGLPKYLDLCMTGTPNMLESLYTDFEFVNVITPIGEMVREARGLFLSESAYYRYKSYAASQLNKLNNKQPQGKRVKAQEEFGFDPKFMYHVVRLILNIEELLTIGSMSLTKHSDTLKDIRAGKWSVKDVENFYSEKEPKLLNLKENCIFPERADETKIRALLINCLEHHYGSLGEALGSQSHDQTTLNEILRILSRRGYTK